MSEAGSHPESQSVLCSLQQGFFLEQHPPCVSWGYKEQIKCCASQRKTASFKICTRLKGAGRTWNVRMDGRRAGRSHPGAAERQPTQPSAEGAGKSGSSPAPGASRGIRISSAALPREGKADGSVFPAPAVALQSHPEQLAGSDALLAVPAPSPAPAVRRIPSRGAAGPLRGWVSRGAGAGWRGSGSV